MPDELYTPSSMRYEQKKVDIQAVCNHSLCDGGICCSLCCANQMRCGTADVCGYAAAALGMRGNAAEKATVGRILGNCIERMLRRDVWAYSQSKNYWGAKPWAPDPCYRENVMYTGHLLQLLALYECFTGDRGYWEKGFDFVWKDGRHVHYDVKRLIDVTVDQMRTNPSGGITCEPNLLFFPCNNHPHIALSLFSKLGYGDWTTDALRWEQWAVNTGC